VKKVTLTTKEKSRLLHDAGIEQVFDLCQEHKPGHQWRMSGQKIQGQCLFPNHKDSNPSFALLFVGNRVVGKCLSCGQIVSDGFKILALITGVKDELRLLHDVLGTRMRVKFDDSVEDALVLEDQFQTVKKAMLHASTQVLHNAMHSHDDEWGYAQDAVQYFQKRGIMPQALPLLDVGIYPNMRHFHDFSSTRYPEAMMHWESYFGPTVFDRQPQAKGKFGGWMLFGYRLDRSRIGRFKLRNPNNKADQVTLGADRTETLGFFGMHAVSYSEDAKTGVVVEGEFDQIALFQDQKFNGRTRQPVIVACGGSGKVTDLDVMADIGVENVIIAADNDKGGFTATESILKRASQDEITDIRVYDWSDKLRAAGIKDPDEAIRKNMAQEFVSSLYSAAFTLTVPLWAVEATKRVLSGVSDPDAAQVARAAHPYANILADPASKEEFCIKISTTFDVDQGIINKRIGQANSDVQLIYNIEALLKRTCTPLYRSGTHTITVYAHDSRRVCEVDTGTMRKHLSSWRFVFGTTVWDFIEDRLGIPTWVRIDTGKKQPTERSRAVQKRMIEEAFDDAVQMFTATVRSREDLIVCRQGVHWANADDNSRDDALIPDDVPRQRVYVVNGDRVYRGEEDPVTGYAHYTELARPREGAYVFDLEPQPWSKAITRPQDMDNGGKLTHKECFEMRHKMLDCWKFKAQEPTQTFLAAQLDVLLPCLAFEYLPFIFFTAQTQSGKSTLLKGLIGGADPKEIGTVEGAFVSEDYTSAGVMQHATGVALPMCLDEFEDPASCDSPRKATAVRGLLEMSRNASTGSMQLRGTRDGEGREAMRRFMLITAGIAPFQQGQDLNRWFTIELENVEGKDAPEIVIAQTYSQDQIEELRMSTTLNSLRDIFKMRKRGAAYRKEALKGKNNGGKLEVTQTRFAKAMESVLAALDMAEYPDVWGFAQEFLNLNEDYVTRASSTEEELMYGAVMDTPCFTVGTEKARYSLVQMLVDPDRRPFINSNGYGVFHVPGEEIVVIWPQQVLRLLNESSKFRRTQSAHQVSDMLARNPQVHHNPAFLEAKPSLMQYLRDFMSNVDANRLLYVKWSALPFTQPNLINYSSEKFDE